MFRIESTFTDIPCPEDEGCTAPYCPFNHNPGHTPVEDIWTRILDLSDRFNELEFPQVKYDRKIPKTTTSPREAEVLRPIEVDIKPIVEVTPTPPPPPQPEPTQINLPSKEPSSPDDSDDASEAMDTRNTEMKKYLEQVTKLREKKSKKKDKEKTKEEKPSKKIDRKRSASRDVDIFGDQELGTPIKRKKSIPEVPPMTKPEATTIPKEKARKLSSTTESFIERKKKKAELKSEVDFSKKKVASKESNSSAELLRPVKPKRKDPSVELLNRIYDDTPRIVLPPSKMGTEYNPLDKNRRLAHKADETSIALQCVPIPNCPVPLVIRQRQLKGMYTSLVKTVHRKDDSMARQVALEVEMIVVNSAKTRQTYVNTTALKISQIKKAKPGDHRFQPTLDMSKLSDQSIPVNKVLADPKMRESLAKKVSRTSQVAKLSGERLFRALQEYILSKEEMELHNYPIPIPGRKKEINIRDLSQYKKFVTGEPTRRICIRCSAQFSVNVETGTVSEGECNYHGGRLYANKTSHYYQCCNGTATSEPCKYGDHHVHEENRLDLTGYVGTTTLAKVELSNKERRGRAVFGMDCEMVYTTVGFEIARVTIIDEHLEKALDKFCLPLGAIIDYNTKYSGITGESLQSCKNDLKHVQRMVRALVSEEDILIGHSLESDLNAIKIHHRTCVDTSVVFPHKKGLPFKRSLKNLMTDICGIGIQQESESGDFGHDSAEDAKAAMQLMFRKLDEDQRAGKIPDE